MLNRSDLVKAAGTRMRMDLAERFIAHPGELGADREEIVRQFLRSYLPKRFDVSTGFAFDSKGDVSQQLDIVISNSLVCPRFETTGGRRYFPCESIVAVGQVKSSVDTREESHKAMANLESVKALDRSADGKAFDSKFQEELDPTRNHLHQIFTFLFITGASLSQQTAHEEFIDYVLSRPAHVWTNVVLALDKYLMTFCCDGGICPNPLDARGVAIQPATSDHELLMRFYLLLGAALEVTRVSSLPYWQYLHTATSWSAEVWYSCADDPSPYLSSITL